VLTVFHVDTERGWRGGERQVLWLATGMRERGQRAIVVARHGDELASRATAAGLEVIGATPRGEIDVIAAVRLRTHIRRERAQIVHAHTAHAAALAALATLGTHARVVVARRVDFRLRRNLGTRLKYARAHAVVAVSRAVAEIVAQGGVPRDRIRVVPDGVDLSRQATPASASTLAALGVAQSGPLVVQVAALVPHKDPVTFVRAIAIVRRRVPDVRALLVGEGPLRQVAESAIAQQGLESTLVLTGFRRDADDLLAAADVAVLSSAEEGMGSVLLDAMHFGVPIAATSAGGIPEVVDHGTSGLLSPPGDAPALAEHIVTLLADRDRARTIVRQAREHVREFSVARMVDRTLGVYEAVI
jgi:glycosyltransferase involved in cell wall biosynthesis